MHSNLVSLGFHNPKGLGELLQDRRREKQAELQERIGQSRVLISMFQNAGLQIVRGAA